MTEGPQAPEPGEALEAQRAALGRVRLGVLALLAGCAVVGVVHGGPGPSPADPRLGTPITILAVLIGLGSVFARQLANLASVAPASRVGWSLLSYVCAGALGLAGLTVTFLLGDGTRGLLYAAAGVIFAIRPPPHFGPGSTTPR